MKQEIVLLNNNEIISEKNHLLVQTNLIRWYVIYTFRYYEQRYLVPWDVMDEYISSNNIVHNVL